MYFPLAEITGSLCCGCASELSAPRRFFKKLERGTQAAEERCCVPVEEGFFRPKKGNCIVLDFSRCGFFVLCSEVCVIKRCYSSQVDGLRSEEAIERYLIEQQRNFVITFGWLLVHTGEPKDFIWE